jgi:ABC-type uncharacterized transport system permease subunit
MNEEFLRTLGSIVANATPLVIASIGETITERAGVINLSLDGSIVLSATFGFIGAFTVSETLQATGALDPATMTGISLLAGFLVAMLTGGLVALLIAFGNIRLRQDQVAIGFVLTLLAADLARFLGQDYTRIPVLKWDALICLCYRNCPSWVLCSFGRMWSSILATFW